MQQLERMIAYEGPENIAAILLEGESGSSGCLKYPVGYLKAVREICNKHGILLIMDEVMSGFGRTGKWFGFQNHDISSGYDRNGKRTYLWLSSFWLFDGIG